MSPTDEAGPSLRAAFEQALARIAALRSAQEISTEAVRGMNPLDLTALDPLTPGAFPGIGPAAHSAPTDHPPTPGESAEPGGDGTAATGTAGADQAATATAGEAAKAKAAEPPPKTLTELLAELDDLTGLTDVKAEIHRQVAVLRIEGLRHTAGAEVPTITRHLVFVGNPGPVKTTVARLVGGIYRALGLLLQGQLVEVDRAGMAGTLARPDQDAEVVASAAGGVSSSTRRTACRRPVRHREAVNTLVKEMEDRRDDLVLIVASYPEPMAIFITQNPGLASSSGPPSSSTTTLTPNLSRSSWGWPRPRTTT